MTAITKGAIKAVKFYKHVVQSVEKFLQKVGISKVVRQCWKLQCLLLQCRPEYKIPGLYVIDSIVRQSRHQFGTDKDVFAPRFSKNINFTFYFIYQCTNEEKVICSYLRKMINFIFNFVFVEQSHPSLEPLAEKPGFPT